MFIALFFSLLINKANAESKYILLETAVNTSSQSAGLSRTVRDSYIQSYAVRPVVNSANSDSTGQRYELILNQQKFQVGILDSFGAEGNRPILKFKYAKSRENPIYCLLATEGTSSRYYHYFAAGGGRLEYMGLVPELDYDQEANRFYSLERDGAKRIYSEWVIKESKFHKASQEISP